MARTDFAERSRLTRDALDFASRSHAGQTRGLEGLPFVTHPVEVACLLHEAGYPDEVVAAGVLHDVLEHTAVERDELEQRFGPEVAGLVADVSEDPSIADEGERKAALREQVGRSGGNAAAVFAADKISKARELRLRVEQGDVREGDRHKIAHYRASLELLERLLPDEQLVRRLEQELDALA